MDDREERISHHGLGGGPFCDKAWHLWDAPTPATYVLRCSLCGTRYARCARCNRGGDSVASAMRAHLSRCQKTRK